MELLNKRKALAGSALILLPALAGLALWTRLPSENALAKLAFCLGMPAAMLTTYWLCLLLTFHTNRKNGQSKKALELIYWLLPCISLFYCTGTWAVALDVKLGWERLLPASLGLMFLVIGNYMPKMKQNPTLGIRLPWTLANEENWNRTHRIGGKVWVAGGLVLLLCCLLPGAAMAVGMLVSIVVLAVVPCVYSYRLYRKQVRDGSWNGCLFRSKTDRVVTAVALVILAVAVVGTPILLFTGDIHYTMGENTYAEGIPAGSRTNGFGSPRLSMGAFRNDAFGSYTRYAYTGCDACIVMQVEGRTVVLSGADEAATKALYEELNDRIFG
ncbi:SdpI family protein [Candidatus Allofournierella merdipullorum]|uniref:SdpI family protein n=1 Tax=Candidatus Allofournierella merdipullorum TaxID=2838595 RepID=UPI002A8C6163|nr:SdpI family protein [Candidatus Fournierella merdipullorum]